MLNVPVKMPVWFDVYPEFDMQVARGCVGEVDEARMRISGVREYVRELDTLATRDSDGPWLETYRGNCERLWHWLGETTASLSRLAGNMDDVISLAQREDYRKEQAWIEIQQHVQPTNPAIPPVPVNTALRNYTHFTTHTPFALTGQENSPRMLCVPAR